MLCFCCWCSRKRVWICLAACVSSSLCTLTSCRALCPRKWAWICVAACMFAVACISSFCMLCFCCWCSRKRVWICLAACVSCSFCWLTSFRALCPRNWAWICRAARASCCSRSGAVSGYGGVAAASVRGVDDMVRSDSSASMAKSGDKGRLGARRVSCHTLPSERLPWTKVNCLVASCRSGSSKTPPGSSHLDNCPGLGISWSRRLSGVASRDGPLPTLGTGGLRGSAGGSMGITGARVDERWAMGTFGSGALRGSCTCGSAGEPWPVVLDFAWTIGTFGNDGLRNAFFGAVFFWEVPSCGRSPWRRTTVGGSPWVVALTRR
mmetsp:Transcript_115165/g.200465  ORF Transcript_115165/g.200465 Transcript_115165/m.200465 type:complete len:322 (+) Transcript_115165:2250-3215(+)